CRAHDSIDDIAKHGIRMSPHRIAKSSASRRGDSDTNRRQISDAILRNVEGLTVACDESHRTGLAGCSSVDAKGGEPAGPLATKRILGTHMHIGDIVDAGSAAELARAFAVATHLIFVDCDRIELFVGLDVR